MVGKKGGKDCGQKKITGFFAKPPSSKQHDLEAKHQKIEDDSITRRRINSEDDEVDGRGVLEDVTNALEDSLQSPAKVVPPEDSEVIERTPEINPNKRKSKIKMRKTFLSKVVGESSKRKLVSDEGAIVTSPVFKKKKERDQGVQSKVENTKKQLDRGSPQPVEKFQDKSSEVICERPTTPPNQDATKTGNADDDMGDLWACLEDSPFKAVQEDQLRPIEQPLGVALGRHTVKEVRREKEGLVLTLESFHEVPLQRTVTLRQSWAATEVRNGDKVHLEVNWQGGTMGVVEDAKGTIVVEPDMLVSSTAVVSSLFCMRKAVLAEKFKGMEGGNRVMLLGTIVHELLQEVLKHKAYKRPEILKTLDSILLAPKILGDLVAIGMSEVDMRKEVEPFVRHIQYFVDKFIFGKVVTKPEDEEKKGEAGKRKGSIRPQWEGKVTDVVDIEENLWSPRLGMKGKIDLTVETGQEGSSILPLEVKTGKPSYSTSHQGQVIIYCMMSGDRRQQPTEGLLLYLGSSSISKVPAGRNEQRGLIQLRNELVSWLRGGKGTRLPDPVSHPACSSCGFLTICSAYQQAETSVPPEPHPMAKLAPEATAHLTSHHLEFFLRWITLLELEGAQSHGQGGVRDLWCLHPWQREERGQAASGLTLLRVDGEILHTFSREKKVNKVCLEVGEVVTVSTAKSLAIAQGVVRAEDGLRLVVELDRKLESGDEKFTVDRWNYQGGQGACYTGLASLLGSSEAAGRLREAIVDLVLPDTLPGLGREVATEGKKVMMALNRVQQKAIFRTLMCKRYGLVRGMPGSGKTTTIVAMVRLMVRLGFKVLLVAYTNSAVDTILSKLISEGQSVLRVGRKERVREEVRSSCAEEVVRGATSSEEIASKYDSYKVVGATCLGTGHPAIMGRQFDWCVVDEASQALLPATLAPLLHASKFVLVGDPAQLPPTVKSMEAKAGGLDESLFSVLDAAHPSHTVDLHLQYRMNAGITALANHLTYAGKLECGSQEVEQRVLGLATKVEGWVGKCLANLPSVIWADTMGKCEEVRESGGVSNPREVDLVVSLVDALLGGGVPREDVAVIAPYSAQVKLLKAAVEVEVGTVDQFQGRDKLVVIYSCTRSNSGNKEEGVRSGHILTDTRRLNVAVTRARAKLVILGDQVTLARDYLPFRRVKEFLGVDGVVQVE